MTKVAELLTRAQKAVPPNKAGKFNRYAHLNPVIETLLASGHSLAASVRWLVAQNQIRQADFAKAYAAIWHYRKLREGRSHAE